MHQKSLNIKQEFKKSIPIILLINDYFWKTKIGPLFSLLFPLLLTIIYFAISKSKGNLNYLFSSLPSTFSLSVLPLILLTLPTMNIEFRNSIILRKIKIIGISKITYVFLIYILFFTYSIIFSLIGFFFFCCFISFDNKLLSTVNWGTMFYGWILLVISGIALGLFLSNFSKTSLSSQLIGFGFLLLTLIFSGQFMPLSVIGGINAIKYISLFSPLSYSANIFNIGMYSPLDDIKDIISGPLLNDLVNPSNNIFDFKSGFWLYQLDLNEQTHQFKINKIIVYEVWQKVLFTFFPIIFTLIFNWLFTFKFKWINR